MNQFHNSAVAMTVATMMMIACGLTVKADEPQSPTTTQVMHRTIKIDKLDIFYREAGPKDGPTVLLLHGFPTSSHMFRNLIPALAEKHHVVAPDYPGFGNRSAPSVNEFDYPFDNLANVIEKFTEKVGLKEYSIYLTDYPYQRDLKNLEFHLLDTGHFALEEDGAEIATLIQGFLGKQLTK